LLALLRQRGLDRLYCDRWVANAVHRSGGAPIRVPLDPRLFDESAAGLDSDMRLGPHTAILARREDAPFCRAALAARLAGARETPVGPWILFEAGSDSGWAAPGEPLGLQWRGPACFLDGGKAWAATLARRADRACAGGHPDQALALLRLADREHPDYHPVVERLATCLDRLGDAAAAGACRRRAARLAVPDIPAPIRFANGVVFHGLTIEPQPAAAGGTAVLRYYWQYPETWTPSRLGVFVHFEAGGRRFQDDHPLPCPAGVADQPLPQIFTEERRIAVPPDWPPGPTAITLGLFDPSGGRRLAAESALPAARRAWRLPAPLDIRAP